MALPALALISGIINLAPALTKLFKGSETSVEVAELAAKVARTVTGTDTNDDALAILASQPDKLIEYQKLMLAQEASLEEFYVQDKNSARLRDTEFLKAGTRNYRADILVAVSILIVFTILIIVILVPDLNEYAKGALTTILGLFLQQLSNVFNFEFGTTRKEEDKQGKLFNEYLKS